MSNMDQGDPEATPAAILKIIDEENPPLRFFVGSSGLPRARDAYKARLELWEQYAELSNSAQGKPKKGVISL